MDPASDSARPVKPYPLGFRLLMPSVTDMMFFLTFYMQIFGSWASGLLNDADTGWHIRNGEHIWQTLAVPRADYFSYTMSGQPWYAWEWLYDLILAGMHARLGLNGVVLFSALISSLTFALLFRLALGRSRHLLVAAGLVLLAISAATIHLLARPHIITWLFTLIWFQILDRFQTGHRRGLLGLPVLMVLWVNFHGGFLIGLALLALYMAGNGWTYLTSADPSQKQIAGRLFTRLGIAAALCLLVTFVNPYGYKLHVHIYKYLTDRFLMDHIAEFMAPNFHAAIERYFEGLLLLAIVAVTFSLGKLRAVDILVILFSVHMGLYAARNIPISSILLTLILAPALGQMFGWVAARTDLSGGIRRLFSFLDGFSKRMAHMEYRFNAHTLPVLIVIAGLAIGLNGGQVLSGKVLSAQFDEKQFPAKAVQFIAAQGIHDHMFNTDLWSGYLIYKLYPRLKVFIDDRHDFYGQAFLKDYLDVVGVALGWKAVLDKHKVRWVLVSPESPLSNTLKEMPEWKVIYDDGVAIIFARAGVRE